jgi:hypothetical protein
MARKSKKKLFLALPQFFSKLTITLTMLLLAVTLSKT